MEKRTLTDGEVNLIGTALLIACDEWRKLVKDAGPLAAQFERQIAEADNLRVIFEDFPRVTIGG